MAEYFDRGQVLLSGAACADLESGSIEVTNGFNDVITIGKGYAGGSKGALVGTITAKRAVPRAGYTGSQDLFDAVVKQKFVSVMGICGGKKVVVTGVPKGIRRDFGVQSTAMEDFSVHGSCRSHGPLMASSESCNSAPVRRSRSPSSIRSVVARSCR
jgi:hypothetical protein